MKSTLLPRAARLAARLGAVMPHDFDLAPADEEIDVVIPVIEKDLGILPLCLEGVRRQTTNRIGGCYLVAPPTERLQAFAEADGLALVPENEVLGYGAADIDYRPQGRNRAGWIFQQLLKLSGRVGRAEHFLVIDADHILLRPHTFLAADGRTVLYRSEERYVPYYRKLTELTGLAYRSPLSYVAHKMLFARTHLAALRDLIARRKGMPWDSAILASLDRDEVSCFSEYETYGTFLPREAKRHLPWRNRTLPYGALRPYDELVRRYAGYHRALTFPEWINRV